MVTNTGLRHHVRSPLQVNLGQNMRSCITSHTYVHHLYRYFNMTYYRVYIYIPIYTIYHCVFCMPQYSDSFNMLKTCSSSSSKPQQRVDLQHNLWMRLKIINYILLVAGYITMYIYIYIYCDNHYDIYDLQLSMIISDGLSSCSLFLNCYLWASTNKAKSKLLMVKYHIYTCLFPIYSIVGFIDEFQLSFPFIDIYS